MSCSKVGAQTSVGLVWQHATHMLSHVSTAGGQCTAWCTARGLLNPGRGARRGGAGPRRVYCSKVGAYVAPPSLAEAQHATMNPHELSCRVGARPIRDSRIGHYESRIANRTSLSSSPVLHPQGMGGWALSY